MNEPKFKHGDRVRLGTGYIYGTITGKAEQDNDGGLPCWCYSVRDTTSGRNATWSEHNIRHVHRKVSLLDAYFITVVLIDGEQRRLRPVSALSYTHACLKAARNIRKLNIPVKQINIDK